VKNISVLSEKIKSSGVFYFKKDNMIRWEYQKPYKYIIIYNGSKVFINDDGKTTQFDAKANRIFQEINGTILSSMKGVITENPNFSVSFFKLQNKYLVKLSPKSNDLLKYVTRIEIYFDDKYLAVTEMNIYEKSGDYTNIVFRNREFNKNIPDSIFNPGM
jgi:outer membrane lipoprotein-sorting protein